MKNKVIDYGYIVDEKNKTIIEAELDKAQVLAHAFGKVCLTYFPYADYGYEDPYNFSNEWTVFNEDGQRITYGLSYAGVEEIVQ